MADSVDCEVLVIGAGPYGLAAGVHLKARGVDVRVFGRPMDFWATKMPAGMLLRSPRVASNIADPGNAYTLDDFEAAHRIEARAPLPLETFVEYGRWFQRQLLPELDQREVAKVETLNGGFVSALEDGSRIRSRRIVIAAGIAPFQKIPVEFRSLPGDRLTHCYAGFDVRSYSGKKVIVIGAGQSALESAALLHESGADVEVITAIESLRWIGMHPRLHHLGPISKMLYSKHDVGPIGISRLVAAPNLVRRIPLPMRDRIRIRAVRPAGSNWLPARLKEVAIRTGRFVTEAKSAGSRAHLKLDDGTVVTADHVLLGTGYSVDISKFEVPAAAAPARRQDFRRLSDFARRIRKLAARLAFHRRDRGSCIRTLAVLRYRDPVHGTGTCVAHLAATDVVAMTGSPQHEVATGWASRR